MAKRIATSLPYTEFVTADGNFDKTRAPIDRIIIHTTVGTAQSAMQRFGTYAAGNGPASAHYIVGLDGKLYHGLEEYWTAYHAGNYAMNQRSIGIEHEDNGDYNGVRPDSLYKASSALVKDICTFYGIPIDRTHIRKHNEVSNAPTGCPDALDIDRIVKGAQGVTPAPTPTPPTPPTGYELIKTTDLQQLRYREQVLQDVCNYLKVDMGTVESAPIIKLYEDFKKRMVQINALSK